MDILQTRNPTWGFFGTFGRHDEPDVAWALASEAIAKATGCSAKDVRTFLDSRRGRDFAEGVIDLMSANIALETAINAAVTKLMRCKISPMDASDYGIPAGLPYLMGFVCHCELEADTGEGWARCPPTF
jgi:hypothetical protein